MGLFESLGFSTVVDTVKDFYDEFKEGQARDEARTVRAEDRADQKAYQDSQSITSKVGEARRLGINPSLVLGGGGGGAGHSPIGMATPGLVRQGGQNAMSASEREGVRLQNEILRAQKEGLELDNLKKTQDLTRSKVGQPVAGGGFLPGSSQVVKSGVVDQPLSRTTSHTGFSEPGAITSVGYTSNPDGSLTVVPSGDAKERLEDDFMLETNWKAQVMRQPPYPPKSALPPGATQWHWSPVFMTFFPGRSVMDDAYAQAKKGGGFWRSTFGWSKGGKPSGSNLKYRPGRTFKWERR